MSCLVKMRKLIELGRKRRDFDLTPFENRAHHLSEYGELGCLYETDFVSPYTRTANNFNSEFFLVLQDWDSRDRLMTEVTNPNQNAIRLGYDPEMPTNIMLSNLLWQVFSLRIDQVFITNLFPFIKVGAGNAPINQAHLLLCLKEFCWPQIQVVQPKNVVCLGSAVFDTFKTRFIQHEAYERGSYFEQDGVKIFFQYHPAAHVPYATKLQAWNTMRHHIHPLPMGPDVEAVAP